MTVTCETAKEAATKRVLAEATGLAGEAITEAWALEAQMATASQAVRPPISPNLSPLDPILTPR